jgi:hypothetical protein
MEPPACRVTALPMATVVWLLLASASQIGRVFSFCLYYTLYQAAWRYSHVSVRHPESLMILSQAKPRRSRLVRGLWRLAEQPFLSLSSIIGQFWHFHPANDRVHDISFHYGIGPVLYWFTNVDTYMHLLDGLTRTVDGIHPKYAATTKGVSRWRQDAG